MARYVSVVPTWTPTAVADTVAMTDNGHHTLQGGVSTQRCELREVYLGGQAGASAPTFMTVGRTSTAGATLTAARIAAIDPATVTIANPPVFYIASTTKPQRSATLGMLVPLSFNAFGGIVRWYMGPDQLISSLGAAVNFGELSLNAFTGGTVGLLMSSMTIEVL
jgi:hypothetical protein